MKKFITNKYILYLIGIVSILLLWIVIAEIIGDKYLIFPDPWMTFKSFGELLGKRITYRYIGESLLKLFIGFIVSFAFGLIFGIIAGSNKNIEQAFKPIMTVLKSIPTASIVFLFLVISGAKNAPIYIVTLVSFPILYEAVLGGLKNVDKDVIEATRVDGASFTRSLISVKLPQSMPYIFVGIASSFALSFKIEIMAEIITGDTRSGLGCAILGAQKSGDGSMVPIFAYSLIAILLILVIDLIVDILKKKLVKN